MSQDIGLLGDGSQANEVESYLAAGSTVSFRAVSEQYLDTARPQLIDLENPSRDARAVPVVAAIGAPALKKKIIDSWPGSKYITVISEKAHLGADVRIGEGSIIAPGVIATTNVTIGKHTLVNIGATISHDCTIGDFVSISPGVHLAGNVKIGDGVFVGIGASISNNVSIAPGSVIGAGTVVLEDVAAENSVVVGVPGAVIKQNEGWLNEI